MTFYLLLSSQPLRRHPGLPDAIPGLPDVISALSLVIPAKAGISRRRYRPGARSDGNLEFTRTFETWGLCSRQILRLHRHSCNLRALSDPR